jgi:hypothetical protein
MTPTVLLSPNDDATCPPASAETGRLPTKNPEAPNFRPIGAREAYHSRHGECRIHIECAD